MTDTLDVSQNSASVIPQITSADLSDDMSTGKNTRPAPLLATILTKEASYSKLNEPDESTSIDSGYASAFRTPGSSTGSKFLQRKVKRLRPFDKNIPIVAQNRFEDLKQLFDEPLYDYVKKSGSTFSAISMKLKVLGEIEDTAKPWIIVLCDKGIAKKVNRFFNQSWVKSECQPCHTDPYRPYFEVLVHDRPPVQLATTSPASVYADWQSDTSKFLPYVDQSLKSIPIATFVLLH